MKRSNPTPPLIVAHRGASAHAPENTLAAFHRALDDGADGIELDVRLAADGEVVVFHDPTLKRIAGLKGKISDLTSKELASIDAGSWFNSYRPLRARSAFALERVPTLRDVLASLDNRSTTIYIELKCTEKAADALAEGVAGILAGSHWAERVKVKSFSLRATLGFMRMAQNVSTALLVKPKLRTLFQKDSLIIETAVKAGVDELSLHHSLVSKGLAKRAGEAGLGVTVWTVDSPRWVARAIRLGVDTIITNEPAKLIAARRSLSG